MDLREYLRVLRRRWLLIVACLLLGTAIGALIIIRSTPQYASTARLFVSTPSSDANAQAYQGGLFSQQRVTAYADLIKGSTVAEKVIAKLQLDETPAALVAPDQRRGGTRFGDPPGHRHRPQTRFERSSSRRRRRRCSPATSANWRARPIRRRRRSPPTSSMPPDCPRRRYHHGRWSPSAWALFSACSSGSGSPGCGKPWTPPSRTPDDLQDVTGAAMLGAVYFDRER